MDEFIRQFNATRKIANKPFHSLCYAPHVQLAFTPNGNVQVCCRSRSVPIGNVANSTLREIWEGPQAKAYRAALAKDVFPAGCGECEMFLQGGMRENHPIHEFDGWASGAVTLKPTLFDFALSNRCNLECVHCSGEYSSLIRVKEGNPPIPAMYGDRFFAELREFMPGMRSAKFVGGEPFLQTECYRVWDMISELCPSAPIFITTNGTVWNAKVEKVLEQLNCDVAISLDGFDAPTMESIRVNARHEILMRNLQRFREAALRRKSREPRETRALIQMNFCVMRRNWRELGDFFLWADSLEARTWVTPVVSPEHESLFTLPRSEMKVVVEGIARQSERVASQLSPRNRPAYESIVRFLLADLDAKLHVDATPDLAAATVAATPAPRDEPVLPMATPEPTPAVVAPPPPPAPAPSPFEASLQEATRRFEAGEIAAAAAALDAAERMIPGHPEVCLARAWILGAQQRLDEALAATREGEAALARMPETGGHVLPSLLLVRALLLQRSGDARAALRCVESRLALLPRDPATLRLRAELVAATAN